MGAIEAAHREAFDEVIRTERNAESTDDQSVSVLELKKIWLFDLP